MKYHQMLRNKLKQAYGQTCIQKEKRKLSKNAEKEHRHRHKEHKNAVSANEFRDKLRPEREKRDAIMLTIMIVYTSVAVSSTVIDSSTVVVESSSFRKED